MLIIA
jgi:hypothetical protein